MSEALRLATSHDMRTRLAQLVEADPSLRVLSYILSPDEMLAWAHSIGVATDPVLAWLTSATPPSELRSIVADPSLEGFLWTGLTDLGTCLGLYEQHASRVLETPRVLDFGCGCGRMTRYLDMLTPHYRSFGCDVNPEHVEWCANHLQNVITRTNGTRPPLPFTAGSFDLVFSVSIMTHLPQHLAEAWIADVARVLDPGGLFLFTTHGITALDTISTSGVHQRMFNLSKEEAMALKDDLARATFTFLPYPNSVIEAAKAGEEYGNAFIDRGWASSHWDRAPWRFVDYLPGGLRYWQDIVVLERV